MPRSAVVILLGLTLATGCQGEEVTLKKAKYKELAAFIAAQKGKVVVVDFWATY
jgi:hypothetical protein